MHVFEHILFAGPSHIGCCRAFLAFVLKAGPSDAIINIGWVAFFLGDVTICIYVGGGSGSGISCVTLKGVSIGPFVEVVFPLVLLVMVQIL